MEVSWRGPRLNESAQDDSAQTESAQAEASEGGAASSSVLHIYLRRLRGAHGRALPRVYAPRFPKVSSCLCSPPPVCLSQAA